MKIIQQYELRYFKAHNSLQFEFDNNQIYQDTIKVLIQEIFMFKVKYFKSSSIKTQYIFDFEVTLIIFQVKFQFFKKFSIYIFSLIKFTMKRGFQLYYTNKQILRKTMLPFGFHQDQQFLNVENIFKHPYLHFPFNSDSHSYNYYFFIEMQIRSRQLYYQQLSLSTQTCNSSTQGFRPFKCMQNTKQLSLKEQLPIEQNIQTLNSHLNSKSLTKTKQITKKSCQLSKQRCQKENTMKLKMKKQMYCLQNQKDDDMDQDEKSRKKSLDQELLNIKYRKKNTQSNIVNRIFSFLTTNFKNKKQMQKLKINEQKKQMYLKYLVIIQQSWKGPIKRNLLKNLIIFDQNCPGYKQLNNLHQKDLVLTFQQFQFINKVLMKKYLKQIASISVVTSKKMKKGVWKQHLNKIRQLYAYLFRNEDCQSSNQ